MQSLASFIVLALVTALISGCASRQDIAQRDDEHCRSYGALPGSDAYVQCRLAQDDIHQRDRDAASQSPAGMAANILRGN